jgi:hypothetical protein
MPPPAGRPTVAPPPWAGPERLFTAEGLSTEEASTLAQDGAVLLPGRLTAEAGAAVIAALEHIEELGDAHVGGRPEGADRGLTQDIRGRTVAFGDYAAEHSSTLAAIIGHPSMLRLAEESLVGAGAALDAVAAGIRHPSHVEAPALIAFDHCNALVRHSGCEAHGWHTHSYSSEDPGRGFVRIFFYPSGFGAEDGALRVVPGSHVLREGRVVDCDAYATEAEWEQRWLRPRGLEAKTLIAPPCSVVVVHTWTAHAVLPKTSNGTRWCAVWGYRIPGAVSSGRMVTPAFEEMAATAAAMAAEQDRGEEEEEEVETAAAAAAALLLLRMPSLLANL